MTEQRPDTDERADPGGTPETPAGHLAARPSSPGAEDTHVATAVPGAYDADDAERERGGDATRGS